MFWRNKSNFLIDIALIALLLLHRSKVLSGMFQGSVGALGDDVQQGEFDVLGHARGVAADVEVGTTFEPLVESSAMHLHAVLNVDLLRLIAREGSIKAGQGAVLVHRGELLFVEEVERAALLA